MKNQFDLKPEVLFSEFISMKKKNKKPSILRVRRKSLTDRDKLVTQVIPDKKKVGNKKKCRKPVSDHNE